MAEAASPQSAPLAVPLDSSTPMFDRVMRYLVISVMAVTGVVYVVAAPLLAIAWIQTPFIGAFTEHRNTVNGIRASGSDQWPFYAAGGQEQDQLLTLNGAEVTDSHQLVAILSQYRPNDVVTVNVGRPNGTQVATVTLAVPLSAFGFGDVVIYLIIPYFIGVAYWGIGLWVYRLRSDEVSGRVFALFCATTAGVVGGSFDLWTTHYFTSLWTCAVAFTGAALLALGLSFPQPLAIMQRQTWGRLVPFGPALLLALNGLWRLYGPGAQPLDYILGWRWEYFWTGACILAFFALTAYRQFFNISPIVREQCRVILWGAGFAFGPVLVWMLQPITNITIPLNIQLLLFPMVIFPIAITIALLRYRLLDTDVRVGQVLTYTLLAVLGTVAYTLIAWGVAALLGALVPANNVVALGLMVFGLVLAFQPLRQRLQKTIRYTFFRGSQNYQPRLAAFGREITRAVTLNDVARAIRVQVDEVVRPAHVYLFLRDPLNNDFTAYVDTTLTSAEARRFRTDVRFAADGALAMTLTQNRASIYLSPDIPFPNELQRDRTRLAVLGSALYTPLSGQTTLAGWLSLGPKLSGEPLHRDEWRFVEAIINQAELAVERAAVISDLERRVRELNVVSQMSQAVNFTSSYDDLLELIYAQASKIVDTRNFYIILKDVRGTSFLYAFYVENNERYNDEENKPWPVGRGLSTEILRTGQPIRTEDYQEECRRRNVPPRAKNFKAWMGVPLNAGADTIGIMSVASFESGISFTEDQVKIFWTIADQAASAIVKARLYQQTEQRARQLATLNEVSTSMASNLDLDSLLQRIIQSSMDILGCEAGSLFLTDEETGEYVFRVAAGPVGQNLVGMRIAPGKGLVGEAMESGLPIIVNDAQNDPRFFKGTDQSTGFITHALMVVPLRRGERSIGAIEVINKRDLTVFTDDDKNLLTAFAGQAAVAIENARLFAQTDQALAERVEELSVLQRIDRELNTALDTQRVLDITLDWAMNQTQAHAGSIGIVSEEGIRVLATRGYSDPGLVNGLALDDGIMGRVARSGQTHVARNLHAGSDYQGVLPSTQAQLTIPILRGSEVIGIVNLESPSSEAFPEDRIDFASRLLDHASVAIENARLFGEVRAANQAKSEFVSTAAHELKTPMTAIKMSADLINLGALGPVNDTQKEYLGKIKNNLERMNTIVSDLNDITRIETGRMRMEIKPIVFPALVDDVLSATRHLFEAKKQTLQVDMPADLPHVLADPNRASQVLVNLLSNAYKYTSESGEVYLRVFPDPATDGGLGWVHIAVRDTGIGMKPEDLQKLFTKFFRSEDRAAREMASGTGLGLSIVKNLVELQGGKIWVESEFRKGSTFHFTLPFAPAEALKTLAR
jgi:signal transduction histidine kinase/nitrate/nitrite-specific signal transduction histidine kinase